MITTKRNTHIFKPNFTLGLNVLGKTLALSRTDIGVSCVLLFFTVTIRFSIYCKIITKCDRALLHDIIIKSTAVTQQGCQESVTPTADNSSPTHSAAKPTRYGLQIMVLVLDQSNHGVHVRTT